jgi:hypothetical protein
LQKCATKDKTKNIFNQKGGQRGGIQLFNAKISPNYASFHFTKVKCIATLLEKMI